MLTYLKLFFERDTKIKNTNFLLGNTFKNSKWTDFKTQNIKFSFLKKWLNFFLYFLVIIVVLSIFLGKTTSEKYFGPLPFYNLLDYITTVICFHLNAEVDQLISLILIIYLTLNTYICKLLFNLQNNILLSMGKIENTKKSPKTSNHTKFVNSGVVFNSNFNKYFYLYKLKSNFFSVNNIINNKNILELNNINLYFFKKINTFNSILPSEIKEVSTTKVYKNEKKYLLSILKNDIFQFNTNLNNYNNLDTLFFFNFNIKDQLKIFKEERWLMRNNLLSEKLLINTNYHSQLKNYFNTNLYNSFLTTKNIWISAKLGNINNIEQLNYFNNTNELNYPELYKKDNKNNIKYLSLLSSNLNYLNFFENSRFWLVKKYSFSNKMSSNIISVENKALTRQQENFYPHSSFLYNLNTLLLSKSLGYNLKDLVFSLTDYKGVGAQKKLINENSFYSFYINSHVNDILTGKDLQFVNNLTSNTNKNIPILKYFNIYVENKKIKKQKFFY